MQNKTFPEESREKAKEREEEGLPWQSSGQDYWLQMQRGPKFDPWSGN